VNSKSYLIYDFSNTFVIDTGCRCFDFSTEELFSIDVSKGGFLSFSTFELAPEYLFHALFFGFIPPDAV